jgi:hypothetical protein
VKGKPASGQACDFTKPQKYIITAPDGKKKRYTVTVTRRLGAVGFANPSFEIFDTLHNDNGAWGRQPNGSCWTFTPKHRNATVGIMTLESPHMRAIPPRDGTKACGMVGGRGSRFSQRVVFDKGSYTISFDRTVPHRVPNQKFPSLSLTLNGKTIMTLEAVEADGGRTPTPWKQYTSPVISIEKGAHTIAFVVGDEAPLSEYKVRGTNLIDNVKITFIKK